MMRWRRLLIPGIAISLAAVLNSYFLLNAYVPSESMSPTIPAGAMVLGDRLAYRKEEPQVGDIIFFRHLTAGKQRWMVKRVIAVPGQIFVLRAGRVYLDGKLLEEEYIHAFSYDDYPEVLVPEGCYIVLGDNRLESNDSRFWNEMFVQRDDILAKGLYVYFPKLYRL